MKACTRTQKKQKEKWQIVQRCTGQKNKTEWAKIKIREQKYEIIQKSDDNVLWKMNKIKIGKIKKNFEQYI